MIRRGPARAALLLLVAAAAGCVARSAREQQPAVVVEGALRGADALPRGTGSADAPAAAAPAARTVGPPPEAEPWAGFARTMLELVNRDRAAAGVPPVTDDPEARAFAAAEARRLVADGFGHLAPDGSKPYQRWSRRGSGGHARENLFRQEGGRVRAYRLFQPASAHARLMRSSGHRATILDPAHTGAGVAVIWDRGRNAVYAVQEFVSRRVLAEAGPRALHPGERRRLEGRVLEPASFAPAGASLHREPAAGSPAARRAARAGSYREGAGEPALTLGRRAFVRHADSGVFRLEWTAPARLAPGDYTLLLFLEPVSPPSRGKGGRAEPFVAAAFPYEVPS